MSNAEPTALVKIYEVNDCLIDLGLKEVVCNNEAHRPDSDVFETLVYLIENRDHVINLDEFRKRLWHDRETSEFEIVRCIMKARRAILDSEDHPLIVYKKEVPGYQFEGEVLELEID